MLEVFGLRQGVVCLRGFNVAGEGGLGAAAVNMDYVGVSSWLVDDSE